MAEILIVDDEIGVRELLTEVLQDEGHSITLATNGAEARSARSSIKLDLVLLDIWMPDTDGITLLKEWVSSGQTGTPVIVMSGHATIDTAVEATRIGAFDYLEKPITLTKLLKTIEKATVKQEPKIKSFNSDYVDPKKTVSYKQTNIKSREASSSLPHGSPIGGYKSSGDVSKPNPEKPVTTVALSKEHIALTEAKDALENIDLDLPLRQARDCFERIYLSYQLAKLQGSMTRLAQRSGLERTHLYRKIRQLGMELQKGIFRKSQ
jgi:DNA-binding NtrC family response regulator